MDDKERAAAIAKHGQAHEKRIVDRRKSRISADERKKKRGLQSFIDHLKKKEMNNE